MQYKILSYNGREVAGTDELDDVAKAAAMLESGSIVDEEGTVVYESPAVATRREHEDTVARQVAEAKAQQAKIAAEAAAEEEQ